mgnify:CR=1 FL=1
MTEQEFRRKQVRIRKRNKNIVMKQKLRQMKKSRFKFKKIRTSKKVLWTIIAICLEILFFSEYMALKTEDTSFMYALIGVATTLIPTTLGYFKMSDNEHKRGQFDMSLNENDSFISDDEQTDSDEAVG